MERREDIDSYAEKAEGPTRREALLGMLGIGVIAATTLEACGGAVQRPEEKLENFLETRWEKEVKPKIDEFIARFENVRFHLLEDTQFVNVLPTMIAAEKDVNDFLQEYHAASPDEEARDKLFETALRPTLAKIVKILNQFRKAFDERFSEGIKELDENNLQEEALNYKDLAVVMLSDQSFGSSMLSLPSVQKLAQKNSGIKVMRLTLGDIFRNRINKKARELLDQGLSIKTDAVPIYIVLHKGKVIEIAKGVLDNSEVLEERIVRAMDRNAASSKSPEGPRRRRWMRLRRG